MEGVALAKRTHNRIQRGCRYHPAIVVKHQTRIAPGSAVRGIFHHIAHLHHLVSEDAVALQQVEVVGSALGVVDHRIGTVAGRQPQQFLGNFGKIQVEAGVHEQAMTHRVVVHKMVAVRVVLVHLHLYLIQAALAYFAQEIEIQCVVMDAVQQHRSVRTRRQTARAVARNRTAMVIQGETAEIGDGDRFIRHGRRVLLLHTVKNVGRNRVMVILVTTGIHAHAHPMLIARAQHRRQCGGHLSTRKDGILNVEKRHVVRNETHAHRSILRGHHFIRSG